MYTDKSPNVTTSTCVNLLELANRLCLPRLVTLVETSIIQLFTEHINAGEDISKDALEILQPCQVWFLIARLTSAVHGLWKQRCSWKFIDMDVLILEFRVSNICSDFFKCICLEKTTTNIQNSSRPNRWATKDINMAKYGFLIARLTSAVHGLWKQRYKSNVLGNSSL